MEVIENYTIVKFSNECVGIGYMHVFVVVFECAYLWTPIQTRGGWQGSTLVLCLILLWQSFPLLNVFPASLHGQWGTGVWSSHTFPHQVLQFYSSLSTRVLEIWTQVLMLCITNVVIDWVIYQPSLRLLPWILEVFESNTIVNIVNITLLKFCLF